MKKVLPGQRLKIPASTFNTMIDAAEDFQRRSQNCGGDSQPSDAQNGIIIVRNQSGADRSRFDVLGLDTPVILPSENLLEFQNRWAMDVVLPTNDYLETFCVLMEPIASGKYGRAMIIGATPVQVVRASGENSYYAGVVTGQTTLTAGLRGANILWEDPTASPGSTRWALVQIPYLLNENVAKVATTAAITTTGLLTIDGVALVAGDVVLVKDNSDNGLFKVSSSAWTKLSQPRFCVIQQGTVWGGSTFVLSASNTYTRMALQTGSAKAAQSSGTPATPADGFTLTAGDRVLVLSGTSAGLHVYTGSAFVSLGQPLSVDVTSGSTNGTKTFFLTTTNTYTAPASGGGGTGDMVGVKAADTTLSTSMDGQSISSGDKVLKVSGGSTGVYGYNGSSFTFVSQASAVAVRLGTTRGRQLFLLDGGGVYQPGFAAYA